MGVQVPDSDKDLTRDYAFEAVFPICRGPNKGSSYMTLFNTNKGAFIKKGVHCVTLGPCVSLAQKLQGYMAAPWTFCYMKYVAALFLRLTLRHLLCLMTGNGSLYRGQCHGLCAHPKSQVTVVLRNTSVAATLA